MQYCSSFSEGSEIILFIDWNRVRSQAVIRALSSAGFNLQSVENPNGLIPCGSSVVLIPAFWPADSNNRSVEVNRAVSILRQVRTLPSPPEIIVFGCSEQDVSDFSRDFLEGARYLVPGDDPHVLESRIRLCLEHRRESQLDTETPVQEVRSEFGLIYQSEEMRQVLRKVKKAASVKSEIVLLTGPTGSGKQKLAETFHRMDPWRRNAPMITLNCAAIPTSLAESELFGHRRGSYTGATVDRMGCFRAANGGTLLLDEIAELDQSLQPKLLRALEERKIRSVGQDSEISIDVRVVATTNRNLRQMVANRTFRMDLYQRLAMMEISVPPLARRPGDLWLLFTFFLNKHRELCGWPIKGIGSGVMDVLSKYPFEGNVRELENLVRNILFNKAQGDTIELEDLPSHVLEGANCEDKHVGQEAASGYLSSRLFQDKMSLSEVLDECESIVLRAALEFTGGNRSAAAGLLRISERTLYNKLNHFAWVIDRRSDSHAVLRENAS